jgi:two-component system nitrogen regulation sensor histidine kinase GlnL
MNPLSILLSFPYGIALFDGQLKTIFTNPAFYEVFQVSPDRSREGAHSLFSDNPEVIRQLKLFFRSGIGFLDHEFSVKTGEGESASVELAINHIDFGQKDRGACVTVRSTVGSQELRRELEKEEKIAMLAMMAAGLAHEIKNPLGGIKGAAQLISREHSDTSEFCGMIVRETERINSLVDELLTLGREKKIRPVKVNIHQVLDETAALQKPLFDKKKIRLIRDYDPSLPMLKGQPDRLKQLFINLTKNGAESMGSGGELRLRTRTVLEPAPTPLKGGKKAMMAVEIIDSGAGIDPKIAKALFTPFNSNKKEGTGLGLVLSLKIARDHGGTLTLKNNRNAPGATARVILPIDKN